MDWLRSLSQRYVRYIGLYVGRTCSDFYGPLVFVARTLEFQHYCYALCDARDAGSAYDPDHLFRLYILDYSTRD